MTTRHSKYCTWNGSNKHITAFGRCSTCDKMRAQAENNFLKMPESSFGMDYEDRSKFYCMTANIPWERCTPRTNPSCGCGKLVYNVIKHKKTNVQKERLLVCVPTLLSQD